MANEPTPHAGPPSTAGATLPVLYYSCDGFYVQIEDPVRRAELRALLARGLNTWVDQPQWLRDLYDRLREFDDGNTDTPRRV